MRAAALALVLTGVVAFPGAAGADSETNRCTVSVTPLAFGSYDPLIPGEIRSTATLTYSCAVSRPISIAVKASGQSKGDALAMREGGSTLSYNVYLDAAGTAVWRDGTGGTQVYRDPAPPPNTNVSVPMFGRVGSGQLDAHTGAYTDMLVVQISY